MARLLDMRGGGSGDGREPYKGKRESPPEYQFVGFADMATNDKWASLYRFSHVEWDGDDEVWVFSFVTDCRHLDAVTTMKYRVSEDESEW